MRILMLSPVIPWPANGGGLVRILEIVRGLSEGSEITFIAPVPSARMQDFRDFERRIQATVIGVAISPLAVRTRRIAALGSTRPFHTAATDFPAVRRTVMRVLATTRFDVIYAHFLTALRYLPDRVDVPVLVDSQNVDREYWTRKAANAMQPVRAYFEWNLAKTIRFEESQLGRLTGYVCVSRRDAELTRAYAQPPVEKFIVAPNGFNADDEAPAALEVIDRKFTIGFMGSLDLAINRNAALRIGHEIRPLVAARMNHKTDIQWLMIGRNPPRKVLGMEKDWPDVRVPGTVPDVRPLLNAVDVFVAPLAEGGGTKLRIVEAMGAGLPIVGSPKALQGIEGLIEGEHALMAETNEQFADAIIR